MRKAILFISIVFVAISFAGNVRSSVAARQSSIAYEGEEPEIPYVTDGLVAMYDGIWNSGIGKHNSDLSYWTDLIGGTHFTVIRGLWSSNGLSFDGVLSCIATGTCSYDIVDVLRSDQFTLEVSVTPMDHGANGCTIGGNNGFRLYTVGSNDIISWSKFNSSVLSMVPYVNIGQQTSHSIVVNDATRIIKYIDGTKVQAQGVTRQDISSDLRIDFKGVFHFIRIYDRALTDEEIELNHLIDRERFGF